MSVKIRLSRVGRKKTPAFRIVVMDSRNRRDGAYIDQIGIYHPHRQPAYATIEEAKALKWLGVGAIPSDTVRSLLSREGILLKYSLMRKETPADQIEGKVAAWREQAKARQQANMQKRRPKKKAKAEGESA